MEKQNKEMRCVSYSTATSYPIKEIASELKKHHRVISQKEVLFIECGQDVEGGASGIFVFIYGTAVLWGLTEAEEKAFLEVLKNYEAAPHDLPEKDMLEYRYGSTASVVDDCIILPSKDIASKLACSYGLAQSIKLAVFENIVKKTIANTRFLPEQLAKHGRIPLSKIEIQKKMGELFIERSSINLHFDALDTPEYFWDHPDQEPLYFAIVKHLDLESRVDVLNRRLDVIRDLFEVLDNELKHQHASRLEWIIIWLIVIEVVISIIKELL
jgi:uncharacterized Rmd1/YagE family protein